ncbi:MAG TPA: hypothetical protein VGQ00_00445 [Candidatus Norongarragalinales archaeon]|jgi:ferritin-like protein|nr:hypothetical protein [Candidatus Norongarragalinales archaeon]
MSLEAEIAMASTLVLAAALGIFWKNKGIEAKINKHFKIVEERVEGLEKALKRSHDELWNVAARSEKKASLREAEKRIAQAVGQLLKTVNEEPVPVRRGK